MDKLIYDAVFERDQGRCQFPIEDGRCIAWRKCGASFRVEAHHRHIRGQGGEDTVENLILLCQEHHMWCHAHAREAAELGLIVLEKDGRYDTSRHEWMEDQIPEDGYFEDVEQALFAHEPGDFVW
jgi:hypothetical protein